ncbi:conjugative transposon TraJ protein [Pedobacter sp. UYP30]|uniref:conjugative transposon protein TraJ n=1 Tax=Pedobacter sp. UYP30 TaxID=1756400 RepID=UPI0033963D7D
MKNLKFMTIILVVIGSFLPEKIFAQGVAGDINGLQSVLDQVYKDMIPLCSKLIGVARGIAGFAALWYIASRVWRQIAAAEPIDFYPLLRPFALGLAILLFPSVLAVMNGVLQPVVSATGGMVNDSNKAISVLLKKKQDAVKNSKAWNMYEGETGSGNREKWYKYTHPENSASDEGVMESLGNDIKFWMDKQSYNFRNSIKQWMSEILQVLYEAAALCINTIRTFYLIVLGILGPLVFGFAVFDGFQHTLTVWLARYVNVFLWLPVANIFGSILGKVQENMLKLDISQVQSSGDTFFSANDTAYLIFMVIGIVGYFTVPGVANYIVHAGGGNGLLQKVNSIVSSSTNQIMSTGAAASGMVADSLGDQRGKTTQGMASNGNSSGYFDKGGASQSKFQVDKLSGK